jgi:protein-disulfide isomerase
MDSDQIVIRKSLLVTCVVGLAALLVGAVAGYFTFAYAFNRGLAQAGTPPGVQVGAAAQPPQIQPIQGKIDVSTDDDPSIGPRDAPIPIVEFSDFQCPYCAKFHTATYSPLMQKYDGKVRFVYRDFPLPGLHSDAEKAAEAANCALLQGQDKYWALNEALYKNQQITGLGLDAIHTMARSISGLDTVALDKCINGGKMADEISKDVQDGGSYGVTATPTFFINGYRLVGAQSLASFSTIIDSLLSAK